MTRVESISSQLESNEVPLEEAIQLFEEGMGLNKQAQQLLENAEQRVRVLLDDGTDNPEGD